MPANLIPGYLYHLQAKLFFEYREPLQCQYLMEIWTTPDLDFLKQDYYSLQKEKDNKARENVAYGAAIRIITCYHRNF